MAVAESATNILSLDDETLRRIFRPLTAADTAAGMATHTQLRRALGDNRLWWQRCQDDWGLGLHRNDGVVTTGPPDVYDAAGEYRAAYAAWHADFAEFKDCKPVLRRAATVWRSLTAWFSANFPEVCATLRPGASAAALDAIEAQLGLDLPPEFRALYRLCDGQQTAFGDAFDAWVGRASGLGLGGAPADVSSRHGLLGGYSFYDMSVCTSLFGCERSLAWTGRLRGLRPGLLVFAGSGLSKFLCLDSRTGEVVCLDRQRRPLLVCPRGKSVLDWLEAFADRLQAGAFGTAPQPLSPLGVEDGHSGARALCLFPRTPAAGMREAVTEGVRVRVSTVCVPEQSMAGGEVAPGRSMARRSFFAYSVRYYLLPTEEQMAQPRPPARPKTSVQLDSRHWVIRDARGQEIDRVDGAGVVGHHPILTPGGEEFVYQSVTHTQEWKGSMEGHFTFVEGTLARPTGPRFDAVCPRFELEVPDYAF